MKATVFDSMTMDADFRQEGIAINEKGNAENGMLSGSTVLLFFGGQKRDCVNDSWC